MMGHVALFLAYRYKRSTTVQCAGMCGRVCVCVWRANTNRQSMHGNETRDDVAIRTGQDNVSNYNMATIVKTKQRDRTNPWHTRRDVLPWTHLWVQKRNQLWKATHSVQFCRRAIGFVPFIRVEFESSLLIVIVSKKKHATDWGKKSVIDKKWENHGRCRRISWIVDELMQLRTTMEIVSIYIRLGGCMRASPLCRSAATASTLC